MKPTAQIQTELGIIRWSRDDPVTPDLVNLIKEEGDRMGIAWKDSPFYEVINLLRRKYSDEAIEELLFDEDEQIIEFASIVLDDPLQPRQEINEMVRLYFPVMLVILAKTSRN